MMRVIRQIWADPVGSKVIAAAISAMIVGAPYSWLSGFVAVIALKSPTAALQMVSVGISILAAGIAVYLAWHTVRWLYRLWWARCATFLSFRDATATLYQKTRAADVLCASAAHAIPDAMLGYHAAQLVHFAKFGKATFYGKEVPSDLMVTIPQDDLWTGRRGDDMGSWITENGVEYADLSVQHRDMRRIVRLVRLALKYDNGKCVTTKIARRKSICRRS